MNFYGS